MLKRTKWLCAVCFMALTGRGVSDSINAVASLANPLDNAGISARAAGMGWAFVAVADDSSALFFNPAGLAGLKNAELALHHNSWLAGIIQETAVMALPMEDLGGLGASVNYVNYGTFSGYDSIGTQVSDFSANRYGFNLGWGKEILRDFSAGLAAKGSMQTIADTSYSDFSADIGFLWCPVEKLRLGVAYSNLGTGVAGFAPASALRLGGSYRFDMSKNNQLLLAGSGAFEPQGVSRLQIGVEDLIHSFLALRIGYQVNLADNQIQGLTGLTTGLGVMFEGFHLDYAYLPYGDLDSAHRISISYEFGQKEKAPELSSSQLFDQGKELEDHGKLKEATHSYRASIQLNAMDARPWRALGGIYFKEGKKNLAISSFEEVLKLEPDDKPLRAWLGRYKVTKLKG